MHRHTIVSGLLNGFVVVTALVAWGASIDGSITALNLASLLGVLALGLMWVHYVADLLAPRASQADASRDYQYIVSRAAVLVAILLHPLLINWYLLDNGFGIPPASYEQQLGTAAWAVVLGWIALVAFLAFEIRKKLPKYRRHIFHANIVAMLLVLIHGFSVGLVLMNSWYVWVWWLLLLTFIVVAVVRYRRYYGGVHPNRLRIALLMVAALGAIGALAGWQAVQPEQRLVENSTAKKTVDEAKNATMPALKVSINELALNNGLDGRDCWLAVDGIVYDASGSAQWKNGMHVPGGSHVRCGNDLTDALERASPHGRSVLSSLPMVGQLR